MKRLYKNIMITSLVNIPIWLILTFGFNIGELWVYLGAGVVSGALVSVLSTRRESESLEPKPDNP